MSDQTGNSSTVIFSGILPTFPTHSRHCLTAASILGDPPIEWMDGRLMEKEKKWRRDNGHCLCCHYPGHIAETCTLGAKKKGKGMEFIKETQETGKVSCNISFPVPTAPPPLLSMPIAILMVHAVVFLRSRTSPCNFFGAPDLDSPVLKEVRSGQQPFNYVIDFLLVVPQHM